MRVSVVTAPDIPSVDVGVHRWVAAVHGCGHIHHARFLDHRHGCGSAGWASGDGLAVEVGLCACRAHRGDLQRNSGARVLWQLHLVLLACIFVNHVVAHQAVLVDRLSGAGGAGERGVILGFSPVTNDRATDHAGHGGDAAAIAPTELAANQPSGYCPNQGAAPRVLCWHDGHAWRTGLARHGHLLVDGGARGHLPDLLGGGPNGAQAQQTGDSDCFHAVQVRSQSERQFMPESSLVCVCKSKVL